MEKKEGVRNKPCEPCRARKVRCVQITQDICERCQAGGVECVFSRPTIRVRKRSTIGIESPEASKRSRLSVSTSPSIQEADGPTPLSNPFDGRDVKYPRHSLLNRSLGLSQTFHARHLGSSSAFPASLFNQVPERSTYLSARLRQVASGEYYAIHPDTVISTHNQEQASLAAIEACVNGQGLALINLYFRILHPTFPILEKKVFLEKYLRSQYREFSPPCLAGVYIQALEWWDYGHFHNVRKPDERQLRLLAEQTWHEVLTRPKLSTIQAGLLLAQRHDGLNFILSSQVTAVAYELGLHLDCSSWEIPTWEKGLRKRLAWSVFMHDKWSSLILGRPSSIHPTNWQVPLVTAEDFPERAEDEDEQEGSTEVEKGRELFSQLIELTRIVAHILSRFYALDARTELQHGSGFSLLNKRATETFDMLDAWIAQLPQGLDMSIIQPRKLNSVGYLYVAYWAARASVSRAVLQLIAGLQHDSRQSVLSPSITYDSALSVFESGTSLVNQMRPEHLQSFWYFASSHSLSLIASLGADLWSAAPHAHARSKIKSRLEEYRWTLRVSAKGAGFMNAALETVNEILALIVAAEDVHMPVSHPMASPGGQGLSSAFDVASPEYAGLEPWSTTDGILNDLAFDQDADYSAFDLYESACTLTNVLV